MSEYAGLPNLPAPQTDDALRKTAASQVDLEIAQGVAPVQSQITTTEERQDKALGQISGMFNNLQPVVDKAAEGVQTSYDKAISQQNQIYAQAQARLQQIRGNRASDAQALAQQIGGPVAIDEFTSPYDDAATDLTYLGAGQELHTLAYAQAGVQQAQGFAGAVFPLVRTEQMASVRNQFQEQIREYEDQIAAIKSQKGAQINKRFNELRTQELQYGLQRAQYQLSRLDSKKGYDLQVQKAKTDKAIADRQYRLDKQDLGLRIKTADRDYKLALRAAGQEDKRIQIAKDELDVRIGELLGIYDGKKTFAAIQEDNRIKEAAIAAGFTEEEMKIRWAEIAANRKNETAKLKSDQQTLWTDLIENAVNPQPGKTITRTTEVRANLNDTLPGSDVDVYTKTDPRTGKVFMENGKPVYFKLITTQETMPAMEAITDPTKLVDYLVVTVNDPSSMSRQRAVDLIKARFPSLRSDWKYGEPAVLPEVKKDSKGKTSEPKGDPGEVDATPDVTTALDLLIGGNKLPDPRKLYFTPSGRMRIQEAIAIAAGQIKAMDPGEVKRMRNWFKKQDFGVPKAS